MTHPPPRVEGRDGCHPTFTRPAGYTIQWVCTCGWSGQEWPSDASSSAGAEMVRHWIPGGAIASVPQRPRRTRR